MNKQPLAQAAAAQQAAAQPAQPAAPAQPAQPPAQPKMTIIDVLMGAIQRNQGTGVTIDQLGEQGIMLAGNALQLIEADGRLVYDQATRTISVFVPPSQDLGPCTVTVAKDNSTRIYKSKDESFPLQIQVATDNHWNVTQANHSSGWAHFCEPMRLQAFVNTVAQLEQQRLAQMAKNEGGNGQSAPASPSVPASPVNAAPQPAVQPAVQPQAPAPQPVPQSAVQPAVQPGPPQQAAQQPAAQQPRRK